MKSYGKSQPSKNMKLYISLWQFLLNLVIRQKNLIGIIIKIEFVYVLRHVKDSYPKSFFENNLFILAEFNSGNI